MEDLATWFASFSEGEWRLFVAICFLVVWLNQK